MEEVVVEAEIALILARAKFAVDVAPEMGGAVEPVLPKARRPSEPIRFPYRR